MKFSDVRAELLVGLATRGDSDATRLGNQFLAELARFDRLEPEEALKMFSLLKIKKAARERASATPAATPQAVAERLQKVFYNDADFRDELEDLRQKRSVTREMLNEIYCALFGRTRALGAKWTREKLIQDIADLRLQRVRASRAAEFVSGKVA